MTDLTNQPFFDEFWSQTTASLKEQWNTLTNWKQEELYRDWYDTNILLQDTSEDRR